MGKFSAADDSNAVQTLPQALGTTANGRNLSTAVLGKTTSSTLDAMISRSNSNSAMGMLSTTPVQQSTHQFGFSNYQRAFGRWCRQWNFWTIEGGPNVLHAYDASNISTELYNSTQAGSRDSLGTPSGSTSPWSRKERSIWVLKTKLWCSVYCRSTYPKVPFGVYLSQVI